MVHARLLLVFVLLLGACNESGSLEGPSVPDDDDVTGGDDDDIAGGDDDDSVSDDDDASDDDDSVSDDDDASDDDDSVSDDDDASDDDDSVSDDDDASDDDDSVSDDDDSVVSPCGGTVHAGDVQPGSASDVAAFCDSGATAIDGDLTLSSFSLDSVTDFTCLCLVTGELVVESPLSQLSSLDGLENLAEVGALRMSWLGGALDLDALDGLQTVGGDMTLNNNGGLTTLAGAFAGLEEIGGTLTFDGNGGLGSIAAFGALTEVGGSIVFVWNGGLSTVGGFGALEQVGGSVSFSNNGGLTDVSGFAGAPGFTIDGSVVFTSNGAQGGAISGFANLAELGGDLQLSWNGGLTTVSGFGSLAEVGGTLQANNNFSLTALSGFGALDEIGGALVLDGNGSLNDISGLFAPSQLDGDLVITWNGQLPTATAEALEAAIGTIGGAVNIAWNQQ